MSGFSGLARAGYDPETVIRAVAAALGSDRGPAYRLVAGCLYRDAAITADFEARFGMPLIEWARRNTPRYPGLADPEIQRHAPIRD